MAESKKRGRPPKTATAPKTNENNQDDLIKQLMEQIAEQNKKMAEMQYQINNQAQPDTIIQQTNSMSSKKVKVINLMHNPLNISTEPNGKGRIYSFKNYGESKLIKYDDLVEIISSYPNTMESGVAYICDKEAVEALGLADEYEHLFDKTIMDRIVWLREETDLDLFLGMNKKLQESTAVEIAKLLNANERIDLNYIRAIKDKAGIDIEQIAQNLKDMNRKPSDED